MTPLHAVALDAGDYATAELLVNKGADVNCKALNEYEPLFMAANVGNKDVCKLLLHRGISADTLDKDGKHKYDKDYNLEACYTTVPILVVLITYTTLENCGKHYKITI